MNVMRQMAFCAALVLTLGFISGSHAATTGSFSGGLSWQIGDLIVCFGTPTGDTNGGTCNALRVNTATNPPTVTLLDQFSDGLLGDTRGVAINNTLHALVTDNGGGGQSKVFVYSIASVIPFTGAAVAHTPVATFTTSGTNIQAVIVNKIGHVFVGNAGGGAVGPSIVELNPDGTLANTFPVPSSCIDSGGQFTSMDLSRDGGTIYFTSGGTTIQKLTLSGPTFSCSSPVANFATSGPTPATPAVTLFDIAVVPAGALSGICNNSGCPTAEALLVVAKGLTASDNDADSAGEPNGLPDPGPGIVSATESGTTVTITTSAPHSFAVNDTVVVAGVGVSGYNGTFTVLSTTSTTFTYTDPTSGLADSAGGTVNDTTNPSVGDDLLVDVCTGSTPTTPQASCAILVDPGSGAVLARYPVSASSTLRSLSLDPLVSDCTGTNCASSIPSPIVKNFWVGDSAFPNFYQVNFATGIVSPAIPVNPTPLCSGCATASNAEGLRVYGAEGANQADLTKLFSGSLASGDGFTAVANYPPPVSPFQTDGSDTNTWTLTQYQSPASTPITLYASLISQASAAGNNSGATDSNALRINNTTFSTPVPCDATTTDTTSCIIWKADVIVPSGAYLSETISSPNRIDGGTDLFVDLHYDVTTTAGVSDCCLTSGGSKGSVHSLHEIPTTFTNGGTTASGCTYSSPVANQCYKTNRNTLNFTFTCSGLSQQQFFNLQNSPGPPDLSLVEIFPSQTPKPAPKNIILNGTNGKAPYRFSTSPSPNYTFQWNLNGAATSGQIDLNQTDHLRGCTFDPTGTVQTFCVDFITDPTCKNVH